MTLRGQTCQTRGRFKCAARLNPCAYLTLLLLLLCSMSDQQRVAIITGAAQGIGRAIALRLAKDGIHVALNDIPNNADNLARVAEEVQAQGGRSTTILADVSVEHEVKAMVAKAVEDLGSVDVVCDVYGHHSCWQTV